MKNKIVISLVVIFLFFTLGAMISTIYISSNTAEMKKTIKLHQVEQLRRSLVIKLKTVQTDFYSVNTPYARKMDSIVTNMMELEASARECKSCHHRPKIAERISMVQSLIKDYENSMSQYITLTANAARLNQYKREADRIGKRLVELTEGMSHDATEGLEKLTERSLIQIDNVRTILLVTLVVTLFLGILVAVVLTKSVTRPVNELVNATRKISSGEYGTTISYKDNTEFGELAGHFNAMSIAVREGYGEIQKEMAEHKLTEDALVKSEKFLSTIFDSILDPFCIIDRNYQIVKINEAYATIKNRKSKEIIGMHCYKVFEREKSVCGNCIVEKTFLSSDPYAEDRSLILDDGSKIWLDIYTYPIFDKDGKVSHVIEYIRDITERKNTEEALKDSEERYVLAARGANDGLWDWDMKTNTIYYSSRWKSMFGFNEDEISDNPSEWLDRIHPDDSPQVDSEISSHIGKYTANFISEHRILHRDGKYRWVLARGLAVFDSSIDAYRMAGSVTDITDRKSAEEQLMFDALHDSLTRLPNRTLFMDRLSHSIEREKRNDKYLFAVVFLDMDRFKVLNDSLGHTAGDKLLIAISGRLANSLRPGDTVARLGGDEFAILLEDLKDRNEAIHIAERIQEELSLPLKLEGQEIFTSASIGITFNSIGYEQPENLLRDADIAMYHAKANGSAKYEIYSKGMHENAVVRLQMETALQQAVKQNEFVLQYQPIVCMNTGEIRGLEALIRWEHPVRGLIGPIEFISIAEETGLIVPIGEWVITEACRQLSIWQSEFPSDPPLAISVNISSKQQTPQLVEHIRNTLIESPVKPGSLVIELTETMIMENAEIVAPLLLRLKEMNVRLHIDDFGTGYSSLSYLHRFPVDVLKIDRSFVTRLGSSGDNVEVVKAITTLAHSLEMEVIAEGVETENQFTHLKEMECDYMQGYLFSKPLNIEGIQELLEKGRFDMSSYLRRN
jgi:diguanylate cyclase (GGDEF)-like protein/PAS domain S-box-containing protein